MNNGDYENVLIQFKKLQEYRDMAIGFAVYASGQPRELIEKAYDDYLDSLRNNYLEKNEGKRSLIKLKYFWNSEEIDIVNLTVNTLKENLSEDDDKTNLNKKTLLAKNVKECPVCKSTDTFLYERRENNGILGPGYKTWVVESRWECNDCEAHFGKSDVNK